MRNEGQPDAAERAKKPAQRRITRTLYLDMREAYRDRPTIGHVCRVVGVGRKMARRAISGGGWPEYGLPQFPSPQGGVDADLPLDDPLAEPDDEEPSMATEQDAIRLAMKNAVTLAKSVERTAHDGLANLGSGDTAADAKALGAVARACAASSQVLKEAVRLQRTSREPPERSLWVQIGEFLEGCTSEELQQIARGDGIPLRLLYDGPTDIPAITGDDDPYGTPQ